MSNCPDWLYIWQLVMSVLEDNAVLILLYPYENICVKEKPVLKQKKKKKWEKIFFFLYKNKIYKKQFMVKRTFNNNKQYCQWLSRGKTLLHSV